MLISHKKFINLINRDIDSPITRQAWNGLVNEAIQQAPFQKKPDTIFDTDEKAIILYCNDELWHYLNDIKQKGFDHLTIVEVAKIYSQIKLILKG